ncbi:Alpha/beta-Hydrolases superfamily protein [Tripterygium wilfordii]|uniref:Alpha/beta-Hydrolases superfamily protein n=1 Tax=Tripterygium wilfordii TaxID=458696 RepID=A0A7J7CEB8_TRIWF|nr:GDSL esterase/lipase At4g10955-like isoform X1 [Tripterygium wilfordii]KAF5732501.1 Alpha/beta-Hydrolases superfamily protein [Tripterygium wilfordii]
MAKRGADEITKEEVMVEKEEAHPYAFHVSGPRNVASPTWKDLIYSSWKDANYKRTAMSCFIQAVYLLELDRQENRTAENALAPAWWMIFKYKLVQILIDERDGSIFGAVLEWDRPAALADMVLIRPSGAPKAVLALRGTLLNRPTIRRDIEDDLRFLAWESLKGSVRFKGAFEALKSMAERYGSHNICVAGHSLGAGFALQVGKALAKEGLYVDAHLFNPPSVSLAMSLKNIGEKAGFAWKRIKLMLPSTNEAQGIGDEVEKNSTVGLKNWLLNFYGEKSPVQLNKWVPHLYVNNSDYICCSYNDPDQPEDKSAEKKNMGPTNGQVAAKLFVKSKGKQRFLEAHGLEQWWSDDLELRLALHNSKVISRQLKSLYSLPASQQPLGKPQ